MVDNCCQEVKAMLMTDLEKAEEANDIRLNWKESEILDIPERSPPEEETSKLLFACDCRRLSLQVSRPMKFAHLLVTEHRGTTFLETPYQTVSAEYLPPGRVSLSLWTFQKVHSKMIGTGGFLRITSEIGIESRQTWYH